MSTTTSSRGFDDLEGMLRLAVEQIAAAPQPAGLADRLIERAAKYEPLAVSSPVKPMSWLYLAAGCGAVAVLLLAAWIGSGFMGSDLLGSGLDGDLPVEKPSAVPPEPHETVSQETQPEKAPALPPPSALAKGGGATSDGATSPPASASPEQGTPPQAFGGNPAAGGGRRLAGTNPSRYMSVAAEGTVLVSTGGKAPITLGAKHAFTSEAILHVWDWSKSDVSRPMDASCSQSFAVSPDGKWVVTADGQRIEIASGKGGRFPNFEGDVRRVLFSRDGRRMAVLVDAGNNTATVRVVEFFGGKQLCEISNLWPAMLPAAFLPDGSGIFLMGSDNFVRRYDAATGQELQKFEPAHQNSVRTMLASPSGKLLCSAGSRGDIYLWEVATGKLLHQLTVEPEVYAKTGVYSVAFSPDEAHVAGGGVGNLLLWSVATGKVTRQFPRNSGGAEHIRFSSDGKMITTIRGFYGTEGPAGEDLLVYPTKQEWQEAKEVE
jgi:hypothetical protein